MKLMNSKYLPIYLKWNKTNSEDYISINIDTDKGKCEIEKARNYNEYRESLMSIMYLARAEYTKPIWEAMYKSFQAMNLLEYLSGLASLTKLYDTANIKWCFPEITSKKCMLFKNSVHPLLINKDIPVTHNDILLDEDNPILVIAVANDGGKTTYLTQIGLLTLLSQIGAPIPARYGKIKPIRRLQGHFIKQRSADKKESNLVMESKQIAQAFEDITKRDLYLLDEPFYSTSKEDGLVNIQKTIDGIKKVGNFAVLTTHIKDVQEKNLGKNLYVDYNKNKYKVMNGISKGSYGTQVAAEYLNINQILRNRGLIE